MRQDYFTHAISIRVYHYLSHAEKRKFISKLLASMKIGGKIFIAIPNLYCPMRWITYKHAPLYNGSMLRKDVEKGGFRVEVEGSYNFFPPRMNFPSTSSLRIFELLCRKTPLIKYIGGLWFVQARKI